MSVQQGAAVARELTPRALVTGVVLGIVLTPCNVYSGLKIGWTFNMSIAALLLGGAFWRLTARAGNRPAWSLLESNISQTTASSSASIISGGLVAPIPALALLTGQQLQGWALIGWVFAVSFLGIWVAWYMRDALLHRADLKFPVGVATATTMKQLFATGSDALTRARMLVMAAGASAFIKIVDSLWWHIPRVAPTATLERLTFTLDPSPLLLGFGAIIGPRTGLSLALGAVLAWGLLGPWVIQQGWVDPAVAADAPDLFGPLVNWLLWPGIALMLSSTLVHLGLAFWHSRRATAQTSGVLPPFPTAGGRWRAAGLIIASALVIVLERLLFDISFTNALLSIPLAFVLAAVVGRVVGETSIPPIGAIGKVSQLAFGIIAPGQAATNLMTANVAGGAAGQCADLMNDFRTGHMVGASPQRQIIAQCAGVAIGSIVGSLVYLTLIPDPASMLLSSQWPAPAVATWKAVAETFGAGLTDLDQATWIAIALGSVAGSALAVADMLAPPALVRWLPRASALGLAFVIPASTSLTMAAGAILATVLSIAYAAWADRHLLAAAAGLVAGESLAGVALAALSIAG
ncbi:MAG: OPT/YSL family transporter [Gammaproteobacteria bacterium]|nr:OPT/YSL family transporter [Gammaproteobacteria bacterium]